MFPSPVKYDPRRKPGPWARIDWSHPLSRGIVGCWLMNEGGGTKVYDISGKGNHGTLTNGANWSVGLTGPATNYDGTDDYIDAGNGISTVLGTSFSVTAIVKPASTTGNVIIASYRSTSVNGDVVFQLDRNSSDYRSIWGNSGTGYAVSTSSGSAVAGAWQFITLARTGNTIQTFFNGQSVASASVSTTSSADSLNFGALVNGSSSRSSFWDGRHDLIVIHNRALSAAEVQQLYQQPFCFISQQSQWLIGGTSEVVVAGHPAVKRMGGVQYAHRLLGPQYSRVW